MNTISFEDRVKIQSHLAEIWKILYANGLEDIEFQRTPNSKQKKRMWEMLVKYNKNHAKLTNGFSLCVSDHDGCWRGIEFESTKDEDDYYGDYELQFDLKKNVVVSDKYGFTHNCKPCNKWSKKSDWFIVEIEDYDTFTTYTDCGYGEYDEHAMFRVVKRYEVCPKCGRMIRLSTKKFESGESKTRWEDAKGFDIRPFGWQPKVKVIGRKKPKNK